MDGSQLRVEPAARLVVAFGDEVGRPPVRELLLVAGEAQSGPGGHSAVKPDIKDIRRALHLAAAGAVQKDRVHIRPVQIGELLAASLLQLCRRADHFHMAAGRAGPDGQGNSPVPLPGDAPVAGIADPVRRSEPILPTPDTRSPRETSSSILSRRSDILQEPLAGGDEDDGRLAAPAVAVAVRQPSLGQQQPPAPPDRR